MIYEINKGVGRPLDFFGLKNQYIFIFIGSVIVAFVLYFALRFSSEVIAWVVAIVVALCAYILCTTMNKKYGVNGLSHHMAMKMCPERVSPKRARNLVEITKRKK